MKKKLTRLMAAAMAVCLTLALAIPAGALTTYSLELKITESLSSVKTSTGAPSKITVTDSTADVSVNSGLAAELVYLLVANFEGEAKANKSGLWDFESDQMGLTIAAGLRAYRNSWDAWTTWIDTFAANDDITGDSKASLVELIKDENAKVSALTAGTEYVLTYAPEGVADGDPAQGNTYTFTLKLVKTTTSTGGGGGSVATKYAINLGTTANAEVKSSATTAQSGEKITLTIAPDTGYVVDTVTVKNAAGESLVVTPASATQYVFTMPAGAVSVSVTMKAETTGGDTHTCPAEKYSDVDLDAWYHTALDYVLSNGLMTGFNATTFGPNTKMSRAMVAQIFYNLEGQPASAGSNPFPDVADDQWYNNAISWAYANGVVSGYGDGTYKPDKDITREELVQIFCNYAKFKGVKGDQVAELTTYNDYSAMSDWAKAALSWGVGAGLLGGKGGNYMDPQGNAVRCEAAQMLMNFCINIKG